MPLRLITGPANAAKAGVVLDAVRQQAHTAPLLVVPTAADADRYRRELVADGAVLGVQVLVFDDLQRQLWSRARVAGRALASVARQQVAAQAVAATPLTSLAPAAEAAGFAPALARFAEELAEQRITPQRLTVALRAWAADTPQQHAYAEELAALIRTDARLLAEHRLGTAATRTAEALDALRERPVLWGGTPLFLYGFDDLTTLQLDVVESLAGPVGVPVTLALTFEAGREVFLSRTRLHQELLALGAEEEVLPADDAYYVPSARTALSHLERQLFAEDAEPAADSTGVRALSGGGERAELELAAQQIAAAIRSGTQAEEIAVVYRGLERRASLIEAVFSEHGVPVAVRQKVPADRTTIGRGLLALLACALGTGSAEELFIYLRTPGVIAKPELIDACEAEARRSGARTSADALALWERRGTLYAVADLRRAARQGFPALAEGLIGACGRLLAAPGRGTAPLLTGEDTTDAQAAAAITRALRALIALPERLQPEAAALPRLLASEEVRTGRRPGKGRVTVSEPQSLRARRVRALYLLGMVAGTFPASARPEPFLGDDERAAINAASGLRLRLHEDEADIEQLYLYAAVSRPTEELVLGWHEATDDGGPVVRSHFVDELARLLPAAVIDQPAARRLGAAGWEPGVAPTTRLAAQHTAVAEGGAPPALIAPLTDAAALGPIRERHTWSASALETWVSCPVRWFVERHLRPGVLEPDAEQLVRGSLAHRVLEQVVAQLAAGDGGLAASSPEARQRLVIAVLAAEAAGNPLSVNPERLRSELRRLELDLVGYLERAASSGTSFTPKHFEFAFGTAEAEYPALELGDGILRLAGVIDRIDLSPGGREAVIYDYKGRGKPIPPGRWLADGKLQVLLYLLAVRDLLSVHTVGGFYQPLNAEGHAARGVLLEDEDPLLATTKGDRVTPEALEALLAEAAERALAAVEEIRSGQLRPRPDTCGWQGGCQYPTICRSAAASG